MPTSKRTFLNVICMLKVYQSYENSCCLQSARTFYRQGMQKGETCKQMVFDRREVGTENLTPAMLKFFD